MKKNILILSPVGKSGQPVTERTKAYVEIFQANGFRCHEYSTPTSVYKLIKLIIFIYINNYKKVFVTMPPFSNWSLCFLPNIKIILDIRDGWSIAIRSGYGNLIKPKPFKAWVARLIEKIAIRNVALCVTCTPGLQEYLQTIANKKVLFIPNGFNSSDYELVKKIKTEDITLKKDKQVIFVCAGKFSEYGKDKVQMILKQININYQDRLCLLKVIGADENENEWIFDYIKIQGLANIQCALVPRLARENLFREIIKSDVGIAVIRDPDYEFGTKVYDYIVCSKPIMYYFENENSFTKYFDGLFDRDFRCSSIDRFSRKSAFESAKKDLQMIL